MGLGLVGSDMLLGHVVVDVANFAWGAVELWYFLLCDSYLLYGDSCW